ncbi:MAG: hypothetical protein CMA41_00895 [Euryarchaeota archaeon]|nr:hypothetical protein [Euryarchaeota archaeon]
MAVVEGIGCSFDSGIDLVVAMEFGFQAGDCSVVEFQRLCFEGCQQGCLVAYLAAAYLAVVGPLLQKLHQSHVHQWLHHRPNFVIP